MGKKKKVRSKWLAKLKGFFESPKVTLVTGIIILVCGLIESFELIAEEFFGFQLKVAHALIIYAVPQVLSSLLDVLEGVEMIELSEVAREEELKVEALRREVALEASAPSPKLPDSIPAPESKKVNL